MKKQFGKTKAGKALLLIGCLLLTALLVLSIGGIIACFRTNCYSLTRDQYLMQNNTSMLITRSEEIIQENLSYLRDVSADSSLILDNTESGSDHLEYRVRLENGKTALRSDGFSESGFYTLVFWVSRESGFTTYKGLPSASLPATPATHFCLLFDYSLVPVSSAEAWHAYGISTALYGLRYLFFALTVLSLAGLIVCYIRLLKVSARRNDTDLIVPGPLNKLPYDLLLLLCVLPLYYGFCHIASHIGSDLLKIWLTVGLSVLAFLLFLGLSMSAAARIKQRNLLKDSLIGRLFRLLFQGLRALPVVWKAALALLVFGVLNLLLVTPGRVFYNGDRFTVLIIINLLLYAGILYIVFQFKKLKNAAKKLADGALDYKVNTRGMVFDEKQLGENLNRLGDGMNTAVEERLKSERMKTELITNVSHDLKTPLTSIINYTDLLKKEESLSEQGREAVEVLSRQSERLNRLIGDLVEASKASSGTLDVALAPCDAAVFVTQAAGEYEETLKEAQLTLLTKVPQEPVRILADGRRMQRIFDNLIHNIRKYSLPGTRVYLDLERKGERAVFLFKNTSRDPLNISADELMERFVRGDSSRHAEGNGLGLAIAKSLAELQGGTLQIQIDGDLFKAVLSFPLECC
ncbi:MAG: HAMP domain-containing histidine kinase [Lachnospiraceae bacterium]|nr:HAMP domain-containing histidine kinase [Lachnospiraceae bacterium]